MMSSSRPSPDLFTILLAMKPAISPNTIQAINDIVNDTSFGSVLPEIGRCGGACHKTVNLVKAAAPWHPYSLKDYCAKSSAQFARFVGSRLVAQAGCCVR